MLVLAVVVLAVVVLTVVVVDLTVVVVRAVVVVVVVVAVVVVAGLTVNKPERERDIYIYIEKKREFTQSITTTRLANYSGCLGS